MIFFWIKIDVYYKKSVIFSREWVGKMGYLICSKCQVYYQMESGESKKILPVTVIVVVNYAIWKI